MTKEQITVLLAVLGIILILIVCFSLIKKKQSGQKKLASLLGGFASIRSFKVINNIDLPLKNGAYTHIDHILIGFFGVMVLENCELGGIIYGDTRDKEWVSVITKDNIDKKARFKNPLNENQEHIEALRGIFQKENIYKISIESYGVFTNPKAQLSVSPNLPVMDLKTFKKLLKKDKYSETGPIDVETVYNAIIKNVE